MVFTDIIEKKKNGQKLTKEELDFFIDGYVKGVIPDYQVSALLMAIVLKGMDDEETAALTTAMLNSGPRMDLSGIKGFKVDKHSTGGVGDDTTLLVAPLVAACGCKVAKMSGRGLGFTGGTLDKLESIPGFNVFLDNETFVKNVSKVGLAIMGQTQDLVPADKKLYALRDVTGTVQSLPLIASSIMSKKIAMGTDAVVLDVKTGNGALMPALKDSIKLADIMVRIGKATGLKTSAVVTDMNQPLGNCIGNALSVEEAIHVLRDNIECDIKTISLTLAAKMLILGGICESDSEVVLATRWDASCSDSQITSPSICTIPATVVLSNWHSVLSRMGVCVCRNLSTSLFLLCPTWKNGMWRSYVCRWISNLRQNGVRNTWKNIVRTTVPSA